MFYWLTLFKVTEVLISVVGWPQDRNIMTERYKVQRKKINNSLRRGGQGPLKDLQFMPQGLHPQGSFHVLLVQSALSTSAGWPTAELVLLESNHLSRSLNAVKLTRLTTIVYLHFCLTWLQTRGSYHLHSISVTF